jgi:predicted GNAT superfamily acetyltransferase
MVIRDLKSLPEFRQVCALEQEIWGYGDAEDVVGIPIFVITIKRGGILLGAYDGDRMIGFVYSLAGVKGGMPMQWSHMLGVRPEFRGTGLGRVLKLEQRRRALGMGMTLMEWTFDPLQSENAHFNFRRLGAVAEEYHTNVYGESSSTLHRGNPTDRLIAQWWMESARVQHLSDGGRFEDLPRGASELPGEAPYVLEPDDHDTWAEPGTPVYNLDDRDLLLGIPGRFTEMLDREPALALSWRHATRDMFTHYLGRGYRVVGFVRDRAGDGGCYRLSSHMPEDVIVPGGR